MTKPRYIADGDAICRQAEQRLRAAARELARRSDERNPSGLAVAQVAEDEVIPVIEQRIADLRALEPPPGDEAEVDRIYDAAEEALGRVEADPELAERGDEVFREASDLASAYGFQECAGAGV